jgi:hypothetical protein
LIRGLQTVVEADEPEGEEMDLLPVSEEVAEELGEARGEARADQVMSEDELHFEDDAAAAQDIADDLDLELGALDAEDEEGEGEGEGDAPDLDKGEEPGPF